MRAHSKYDIDPLHYYLFNLNSVRESEWKNYEADNQKFSQLLTRNSTVKNRRIAGSKLQFYNHCMKNGLPIIPILCIVTHDRELGVEGVEQVNTLKKWKEILKKLPSEMYLKSIIGTGGKENIALIRKDNLFMFADFCGSSDDIFYYLNKRLSPGSGYLVQPRMHMHPSLMGFVSTTGLSTVRAITLMRNGKAELIMACLKLIVGNNIVDNFMRGNSGPSGNLVAAINLETGELTAAWGPRRSDRPKMVSFSHHPDTGKKIEGFVMPFWRELVQLSLNAQESLPFLKTIGWDIAITNEGTLIVEANTTYGISILQVAHQRGLKGEFNAALSHQIMVT